MGIKVYGVPMSTSTRTVLVTLYEKNVDYDLVLVDMANGEHKQPKFMALQPFGKIPVLQDEDLTLFESRAIARYVANKFEGQGTALLGSSPNERALIEQWIEVNSQNWAVPVATIVDEVFFKKLFTGEDPDEIVVAENAVKFSNVLDIYEAHLSKSKYLAGDSFSLADAVHLPDLTFLMQHCPQAELVTSRKHVNAWFQAISNRPAWLTVQELAKEE